MLSSASVPPSALRHTVQHSMSKMQLPWKKIHVCLFLLEQLARRCSRASLHDSHGQAGHCQDLLAPWEGSEMGWEKEEKGSPGSSAQETTWPVYVDLLIFGVDAVWGKSWVFFLYLSVPFYILIKISKNDRATSGWKWNSILISLHPIFYGRRWGSFMNTWLSTLWKQ